MHALAPLVLLGIGLWYLIGRRADDPGAAEASAGPASVVVDAGRRLLENVGRSVTGGWHAPASADPYREAIAQAEIAYGLPRDLLLRQLDIESDHFSLDVITGARLSSAGAIGIAQFEPATAAELGVDPRDPYQAIDGAARYMRSLYDRFGDWFTALVAYNWGQGNVAKKGLAAAPAVSVQDASTIIAAAQGAA